MFTGTVLIAPGGSRHAAANAARGKRCFAKPGCSAHPGAAATNDLSRHWPRVRCNDLNQEAGEARSLPGEQVWQGFESAADTSGTAGPDVTARLNQDLRMERKIRLLGSALLRTMERHVISKSAGMLLDAPH
jgi:hypothetical protein